MVPVWGAAEEKARRPESAFVVQERLDRGTQQTTRFLVRYKVIKISWLLSTEDLVG